MRSIVNKNDSSLVLLGASGVQYHFLPHSIISMIMIGEKHVPKIFLIINKEEDETNELIYQPVKIGIVDDLEILIEKVHMFYQEKMGTGSFYYSDLDDSSTKERLKSIVSDILENRDEYPHLALLDCSHSY